MESYEQMFKWIASQQETMLLLLEKWANINSGSENLDGLALILAELKQSFGALGGVMEELTLPPRQSIDEKGQIKQIDHGKALHIHKHPQAPIKALLVGHMDTVFPVESDFQTTTRIDKNTLNGPGVADMKGGLVVLLMALLALEKSSLAGKIGWEVMINPDEEVGSVGSESYLIEYGTRNHLGLVFEPAFSDGSLVGPRKGSLNFSLVARGRSAHAGRDFFLGKNAISAMSRFIVQSEVFNDKAKGITINTGRVVGGIATNIVPNLCVGRFNLRAIQPEDLNGVAEKLQNIISEINKEEGISLSFHPHQMRLPKLFDEKNENLFNSISSCAQELGMALTYKPSGGVCDGNLLSYLGLPVIDTMGVVGGNLHTFDEYMIVSSLVERTQLTALFLMKLANGDIELSERKF